MTDETTIDETARENQRLVRRIKRLELTLQQVEQIRDGNASLLSKVLDDLDAERTRSHELLLNVLPAPIVARLDAGESHIADGHDHVAVLMADLVGFTQTASTLSPAELVDDLNELFTQFDESCVKRGVEKIKTIGDAYMAVAGLDEAATEPVVAAADLALDMLEALKESRTHWQIRIGLHVGPVVAGIIGSRKFAYDVWGDAVNVASRLESTSLPDRIQVSQPVAEKLDGRFELESRGQVEIKGKGPMPTWFVVGRL